MEVGAVDRAPEILSGVDGPAAETEILEISRSLQEEPGGFRELLLPGLWRALLIAVALAFYQQFTAESIAILHAGGVSAGRIPPGHGCHNADDHREGSKSGLHGTRFWLVDPVGRRPLLLVGTAGMAIGNS